MLNFKNSPVHLPVALQTGIPIYNMKQSCLVALKDGNPSSKTALDNFCVIETLSFPRYLWLDLQ